MERHTEKEKKKKETEVETETVIERRREERERDIYKMVILYRYKASCPYQLYS